MKNKQGPRPAAPRPAAIDLRIHCVIQINHIKQVKRQSDCSGGELSPQPHINNIGLCVHYMIYRIKLINDKVIQSNNINYI